VAQTFASAEPRDTLAKINMSLIHRSLESRFATAFFGVLSPDGLLTYCNAGHNPPMLIGAKGVRRLEEGGLILGMFEHVDYDQGTARLDPGDTILVFSDGVSEALSASNEEFGEPRLQTLVSSHLNDHPDAMLERVLDAVREFTTGAVQNDDVTALVVRYTGA
jgi:sigma-B regulation protein RsbU (phosphoserine phosphatase)